MSRSKNILDENDIFAILNEEDNPSQEDSDSEVEYDQIIGDLQSEDVNNEVSEYFSSF